MTDRLTLTRAFEGAGIGSEAAERIATEIYDAIHDNVATKADVDHAVATLRSEMREMEQRIIIRLGVLVVVVAGLLFAALHLWPVPVAAPPSTPPAQHAALMLAGDQPPYSCRLLYDEQRKCAFGACDARVVERLKRECLRDGGRP